MTSIDIATATRPTAGRVASDPFVQATILIAHVSVVAVGFDFALMGIPTTLVLGVALAPLWVASTRRYAFAVPIQVLIVLSAVAGVVLAYLSSVDHSVNRSNQVAAIALLLSGAAALGLLLWARTMIPLWRVVVLYGVGSLASVLVAGQTDWKFDLSVPVTLILLGLLEQRTRRVASAVAVTVMGITGILNEGRSLFGFCVLAATLTLWQQRAPGTTDGPVRRWRPVALLVGLGFGLYLLASSLLTGGYLGETLRDRSVAQVEATGSLLTGGRPEWAATRELIQIRPEGYGAGVVPSWADLEAGKSGLASIRIDAGGYTNNYMFGGQFRLHSVAADLWVSYGWVGIALALTVAAAILASLGGRLARRRAPTSVILTSLFALWFLGFGPIFSNWIDVCAALGFVLLAHSPAAPGDDGDPAAAVAPSG